MKGILKSFLGLIAAVILILAGGIVAVPALAETFHIDYDAAVESGDLFGYLDNALLNAEVSQLDSGDLADIADYIEYAAAAASVTEIIAENNSVNINDDIVKDNREIYQSELQRYSELLDECGILLNRALEKEMYVIVESADLSSFVKVIITAENLDKLSDFGALKIIIGDRNEYIALSEESMGAVRNEQGDLNMQIRERSGTYTLRFLDKRGGIVEKYSADMELGIPADAPEDTVYVFRDNKSENWGGQYDASEKLMEFATRYSGEYSISEPDIVINDIGDLSEYEQDIIRFMSVRQYFEVDNGLFNPNEYLSRYQFTQALVRMMFAIDDEAICTFSDVNEENYRYVASSQEKSIVKGFEDGTFRGSDNVTGEQVIALASRTISEKNGYLYPDKTDVYLSFTGESGISSWADKEVALAVREGIYDPGMRLELTGPISRCDAAVILYRLFMIMNNTPEMSVSVDVPESTAPDQKRFWTVPNAVMILSVPTAINAAFIYVIVLRIKKMKNDREYN